MFEILSKEFLNEQVVRMQVLAPLIAKKARPGQFIIFRVDEFGERIPLTIADYDALKGSVTIIFQIVGASTMRLSKLNAGDFILDFAGPLGMPSHLDGIKRAAVVVGGLGAAIGFPQAKYLHESGCKVDIIAGFRNKDIVILEKDLKKNSENLYICTDDGSYGEKGLVTDVLKRCIEAGAQYDMVFTVGPVVMMKFVSLLTKEYSIPTTVSMNPIMIDGTGMCGCCRVNVDGKTKFACVDGPEFDGHLVDFDELIKRNSMYQQIEHDHACRLLNMKERVD